MKKKIPAFYLTVCVITALMAAVSCRCGFLGCPVPAVFHRAAMPTCHSGTVPADKSKTASEHCCGKCQIEKAAVLYKNIFASKPVTEKNTLAVIAAFGEGALFSGRTPFSYREYHGPPANFFAERVFISGLSFRAPPAG